MKTKKKVLIAVVVFALIATLAFSAYAVVIISKNKNKYQIAYDQKKEISIVDEEENFKFTPIEINDDAEKGLNGGEITDDPKLTIYNKMLNSIDFIDKVFAKIETSMLRDDNEYIEYYVDIGKGVSYQKEYSSNELFSESFSNEKEMVLVNNVEKTIIKNYLPTYTREDTPYIPLSERITTAEDGIPCYNYRRNITNCPLAAYCLVPQEITFSYLKNFDNWNIEKNGFDYLGEKCIEICGSVSPYIAEKHTADSFKMIVEENTGILMKFETYKDGEITNFIEVKDIVFNYCENVKEFVQDEYEGYSIQNRFTN